MTEEQRLAAILTFRDLDMTATATLKVLNEVVQRQDGRTPGMARVGLELLIALARVKKWARTMGVVLVTRTEGALFHEGH